MRKRLVCALVVAFSVIFLLGAQDSLQVQTISHLLQANWEAVTEVPQTGGYGEAITSDGESLYIIQAYSKGNWSFWRYYPCSGQLEELRAPPERPKNGAALAWDGEEYIYAFLGGAYKDTARRFFYRYHICTNTWSQLSNTLGPQGAGDAVTWCGLDNKIYAFTGNKDCTPIFASYNIQTDTWERLPFNPRWSTVDDGAALVWAGDEWLYALAGEWEETLPCQNFARYHIPTQTWEPLPDIPDPGGIGDGGSLLWIGNWVPSMANYIFALGGGSATEEPGYGFYLFDLATLEWFTLPELPCPVGYYVGNRLAYADGAIWYWQGAPSTWPCGGRTLLRFWVSSVDNDRCGECVSWGDAKHYLGKTVWVRGPVVDIGSDRYNDVFLNLGCPYPQSHRFTVVIWARYVSAFENSIPGFPESLQDKDVCVLGTIEEYKGIPEIQLSDPNKLVILEE